MIAIISILAALLMPSLAQARAKARSAGCANNLRQIYQLVTLYANDNNGVLPASLLGRSGKSALTLIQAVSEAMGNQPTKQALPAAYPIVLCPERPLSRLQKLVDEGNAAGFGVLDVNYGAYVSNPYVLGLPANGYPMRTLADFTRPAQVWAFADGRGAGAVYPFNFYVDRLMFDHNQRAQAAMVDGHVESFTRQQFVDNPNDMWGQVSR